MKKKDKQVDTSLFKEKLELLGIKHAHIADRMGMSPMHFQHALRRGFTKEEVKKLELIFKDIAAELKAFKVPAMAKHPGYTHEP